MKTRIAAPSPRPSDDELLEAIAQLPLRDMARLLSGLRRLLARRISNG